MQGSHLRWSSSSRFSPPCAARSASRSSLAGYRRAGWAYTYNSRGLGRTAGFLTGWMMVFGYALYVPAAIGLTSAYASNLLAVTLGVNISGWVLFLVGLGFVTAAVNAAIRILFAMGRDRVLPGSLARLSRRRTPAVSVGCLTVVTLLLGLPLTYVYGGVHTFGYLGGAAGLSVVLVYLAVNVAVIRAFRTEFREEFRLWRHLVIPAAAALLFLFPLWGILHPPAYTLMNLLVFTALGWLCIGAILAGVLRIRRPASFEMVGRVFMPDETQQRESSRGIPGL